MFRNRRNSQKPTDEFYAAFKQSFPEVKPGTSTSSAAPSRSTQSLSDAVPNPPTNPTPCGDQDDDPDVTPKGSNEPWRFTPSLLDANSFSFSSFANQPPGCFTPNLSSLNTLLYHNQAGDLHTPSINFNLSNPLSNTPSGGLVHSTSSFDMHNYTSHIFNTPSFSPSNAFTQPSSYAPSSFVHQESCFETMGGSPVQDLIMELGMRGQQPTVPSQPRFGGSMAAPPVPTEKFRYHVTMSAPTAMIHHVDEIPVTYLNKGQAYSVSIIDGLPLAPSPAPTKYRTVVRISFEDEQQRQRPGACWQLWKEGRGLAEAHQRGGKLQAVEYVEAHPGGDDNRRSQVELESASFDSFAVTWMPAAGATTADCSVAVRFNFLSTDFSHSKGVKGIPVRLCAKTVLISSGTPDTPIGAAVAEVCFCKVKLFRDHGAERKLSNDVAHVRKTIDKLKQQISSAESGMRDFGKRKRSGSIAGKSAGERPGKVQKHKRTWSVSSHGSAGRPAFEEDLHQKLATVQDMFASTRPVSLLNLRGLEHDDPDLFPVHLAGEPTDLTKVGTISRCESWEQRRSVAESPLSPGADSPVSLLSPSSQPHVSEMAPLRRMGSLGVAPKVPTGWISPDHRDGAVPKAEQSPEARSTAVKVPKAGGGAAVPDWIEALGVDTIYDAPPERSVKPIACVYVLIKACGTMPEDDCYRAVYLMQRTVEDLVRSIAAKCGVDATRVVRTLRINAKGLKIKVDDEVVRELPEGQDMTVEFSETDTGEAVKPAASPSVKGSRSPEPSTLLEMKLVF